LLISSLEETARQIAQTVDCKNLAMTYDGLQRINYSGCSHVLRVYVCASMSTCLYERKGAKAREGERERERETRDEKISKSYPASCVRKTTLNFLEFILQPCGSNSAIMLYVSLSRRYSLISQIYRISSAMTSNSI